MGHDVDVVTMAFRDLPLRETVDGVRVTRVPCLRRHAHSCSVVEAATYLRSALPVARKIAASARFDLVHAHFLLPDGWIARSIARDIGLPYIVTAHGSDVPGYNPHRLKLAHRLLSRPWRAVVRDAAVVVSPSRFLDSLIHASAPDARTEVVPNGIDPAIFRTDLPREPRVLTATRLVRRKGIGHVIATAPSLPEGWSVEVLGDGTDRNIFEDEAASFGGRVRFSGWIDGESAAYRDRLERASVFALPSEAENFPVVLLEAMCAGLPVVTTSGTGCEEVVGDAGILVPPGDREAVVRAIVDLANDEALRSRLGEAGRKRVESLFSWDAVARRYLAIYERIARRTA